ncbi:hypothetical protein C1H76_2147 [Elsinoe australis]|uniref:ubiquitinyl hydrolase 1 n=1 Tax=Elsinoe australis TaxID=40998 RepID=A0A4U7BC80_9PEZI|nr:hypothetical protein C1H76_2147 [Elsinoe australis]
MSGVHRLLTRKDKRSSKIPQAAVEYGELGSIFVSDPQSSKKKPDKEEEKKVKAIQAKLQQYGITKITPSNIEYTLRLPSSAGSADEAFRLCLLLEDTYEGLLKAFNPSTKLLGAVNREGVTCYLDALLFAMFARLDGFEAMLYNSLEDAPRKKLAGLLRLWVNLLRTGRLITTDVTQHVQAALAECGWEAANRLEQQDTSEAFTFITEQLELPLLTLKMDLYHTGKEDPNDDHKFVNERLLEVAILEAPTEGKPAITLEDCLEHYFNNRVEVKRHLERQRRESLKQHGALERMATNDSLERQDTQDEKLPDLHIETIEVADHAVDSPSTPTPMTPAADLPKKGPIEQLRPTGGRTRADSIFSQRKVKVTEPEKSTDETGSINSGHTKKTKASTRTEVLMPAWQFFKLLPWYTDNMPTTDVQVAAHFATKRPILGICLKRYMMSNTGECSRLDTYVDIPLEIAVPDFVSDDSMEEGSPLVGNFKLVLQSVVCHRGKSVHSGHYISLVRGHASNATNGAPSPAERPSSSSSNEDDDSWMLFDDLARERIRYVNIYQALKEECPYLLFYQVQPIDEMEPLMSGPPSYDEAISRTNSEHLDLMDEKIALPEYSDSDVVLVDKTPPVAPNGTTFSNASREYLTTTEPPSRTSMDILEPRSRLSTSSDGRRRSIAFDDRTAPSFMSISGPPTPSEEGARLGFLGLPSRRGSKQSSGKKSKSRPNSIGAGEAGNRFSLNMSRLTTRISKSELPPVLSAGGTPTVQVGDQLDAELERVEKAEREAGAEANGETGMVDGVGNGGEKTEGANVLDGAEVGRKKKGKGKERDEVELYKAEKKKRKKGEVPDRDCKVM